jgi:hypothetical protein
MLRKVSFASVSSVFLLVAPATTATPAADARGICVLPAPANLVATANGDNRVDITWDGVAGAESYAVYRSFGACPGGTWLPIALNVPTNAWSDLYVPGGQTFSYTVSAFDADEGCHSPLSACDDATGTGPCPTPGPAELVAPVDGISGVVAQPSMYWEPDPFASSFDIEIDDDPGFTSAVYTNISSINNHSPTTPLPAGILLYWRVRSDNVCGMGANSAAHRFLVNEIGAPFERCFDVDVPIPDNNPAGVTDVQFLAGSGRIVDLDLRIVMLPVHSWIGDLIFKLSSDEQTPKTLLDRPGNPTTTVGCSANMSDVTLADEAVESIENPPGCTTSSAVITGAFTPFFDDLYLFDGTHLGTSWTLFASDNANLDTGTIDEWCLIYSQLEPMPFLDSFELGDTASWSQSVL